MLSSKVVGSIKRECRLFCANPIYHFYVFAYMGGKLFLFRCLFCEKNNAKNNAVSSKYKAWRRNIWNTFKLYWTIKEASRQRHYPCNPAMNAARLQRWNGFHAENAIASHGFWCFIGKEMSSNLFSSLTLTLFLMPTCMQNWRRKIFCIIR